MEYVKLNNKNKTAYVAEPRINLSKCFIIWNIPSNPSIVGSQGLLELYNQYLRVESIQKWFKEMRGSSMLAWTDWLILYHSFAEQPDNLLAPNNPSNETKKHIMDLLMVGENDDREVTALYQEWMNRAGEPDDIIYAFNMDLDVDVRPLHDIMRLRVKNVSFDVHNDVYNNLLSRYNYRDNDVKQQVWALLGNYYSLNHPPYQRSFVGEYITILKEKLHVTTEWFASPMNSYYDNYYSLFRNDTYFGSLGNIFNTSDKTTFVGWHQVFPPFIPLLMEKTVNKVIDALKIAKGKKESLGIVLVLPESMDLKNILKSPYYLGRHDITSSMPVFCSDGYTRRTHEKDVIILFLATGYKQDEVQDVVRKLNSVA
jgi:hypothetical protein